MMLQISMRLQLDDKTEQSLLFKRDLHEDVHNLKEPSIRQQAQKFPNLFKVLQTVKSAILLSCFGSMFAAIHSWMAYISLPI